MMHRFFEILQNNEPQQPGDVTILLDLLQKYPECKALYALILAYPVDIFNSENWMKAEIFKLNQNEIYANFEESLERKELYEESENEAFQFENTEEKMEYQRNIIKNYLDKIGFKIQ